MANKDLLIGVDVGGTKIYACVLTNNATMEILGEAKLPTHAHSGKDNVVERIIEVVELSLNDAKKKLGDVEAIGLAVPGSVDVNKGKVLLASNLGWENISIKKIIEQKLNVPIYLDNDANLGTLAEQRSGAGKGADSVVGVFWGTGIGGGLVLNNQIFHGNSFSAGEIGHSVVDRDGMTCSCGNKGCLETRSSKWAITKNLRAKEANISFKDNRILKSKKIKTAFLKGEKNVIKELMTAIDYLSISIANIINILNPQTIILGGGMIESMEDELMPLIKKALTGRTFPSSKYDIKIAKLGDHSVALGAAILAHEQLYLNHKKSDKV